MNRREKKTNKKGNKKFLVISIVVILVLLISCVLIFNNSYVKEKILERKLSNMAEEYYTEKFIKIAKSYMAEKGRISINLETLKDYGKDTSIFKNTKTGKKSTDVGTYVTITIDKDTVKDWSKDYKVEKVVIDCFD